jgi:hypothetical protein
MPKVATAGWPASLDGGVDRQQAGLVGHLGGGRGHLGDVVGLLAGGRQLRGDRACRLDQLLHGPLHAAQPLAAGPRQDVEGTRVSIYNEGAQAKFPLPGLKLKNTSGPHLMQGPVTVFEGGTYAGDARVSDLQPNEERLLSYAVDLGTEVKPEATPPTAAG